ncbi:MAG: tyrosine-type recombinase/integrase [Gemmatimonadota bacterium]
MGTRARSTTAGGGAALGGPEGPATTAPGGPTTLVTTTPAALGPLAELAQAARARARASRAQRTLDLYAAAWARYDAWRSSAGLEAASAQTLALYLEARAQAGRRVATIELDLAAVRAALQARGTPLPPLRDPACEGLWRVLEGIRRTVGEAQRQAAPLGPAELQRALERDGVVPGATVTLRQLRDRALLLVGFGAALRRSELVALEVADLDFSAEGMTLAIRRSKTDQTAKGAQVAVHAGQRPTTCPVRAVRDWLGAAKIIEGPVFRQIRSNGTLGPEALTAQMVSIVVKHAAVSAGLDPAGYSGHSLRAGLATTAAQAGKRLDVIMTQGRWLRAETVQKYIRRATLFDDNASEGIGL